MKINSLELTHFRNYPQRTFTFDTTVAIIGTNGIGKTNILEAIRFLSVMKSFRARKEREVISFGQDVARVKGQGEIDGNPLEIALGLSQDKKQVSVSGVKKPISQAVGLFKTVLFAPDDLDFINGPPSQRRKFLDTILSQLKPTYLTDLLELNRVIKQRNALLYRLPQSGSPDEMAIWDDQLISLSKKIQTERETLIQQLSGNLSQRFSEISRKDETLVIYYHQSKATKEALQDNFLRDVRYKETTLGAHRDDFSLLLNKHPIALYGSRGERRLAVLAIKQAEIDVLTKAGEPPILLLDDILSELDPVRQNYLVTLFDKQQTFLTATDLPKKIKEKTSLIITL